jgi:ABC-type branched-subunit amino acid transport system substrate-binding protein
MNPVSEAAEKLKVPCIVDGGPDTSWTAAGPYDYSFACAMRYDKQVDEYFNAFDQMETNKKIGLVLDSSMDGVGMLELVKAKAAEYGYTIVNPEANELAQEGATDFTAIVQKIQAEDADIMLASLLGYQLSGSWANVDSLGYEPKIVILSKGMHFSSDVLTLTNAEGDCTGTYTCIETQWTREYPFTSSLLGKTAEELSADFSENVNEAPDVTIGWDYVFFDLIDEALKTTKSLSSEDIVAALEGIKDFDCIYGTLSCAEDRVFETPITFGQWVPDEKWGLHKVVTSCKHVPAAEPILQKQVYMQWD